MSNKTAEKMFMRALSVLAVLLLCSCAEEPTPTKEGGVNVSNGLGEATLYSVTMKDGTRCVALIGYHKGGVTCDWSSRHE